MQNKAIHCLHSLSHAGRLDSMQAVPCHLRESSVTACTEEQFTACSPFGRQAGLIACKQSHAPNNPASLSRHWNNTLSMYHTSVIFHLLVIPLTHCAPHWYLQVWAAPLLGGARAVVLFNRHVASDEKFEEHNMTLHWSMVGYPTDMEVRTQ